MHTDPLESINFLTPEDVARRLRVSIFTVRRWIHQGELPAYRIGRGWRIGESDFTRWLQTRRQTQEVQPGDLS